MKTIEEKLHLIKLLNEESDRNQRDIELKLLDIDKLNSEVRELRIRNSEIINQAVALMQPEEGDEREEPKENEIVKV